MKDQILLDGDKAQFIIIPPVVVAVNVGTLQASGSIKVNGKKVCIEGDEDSAKVEGVTYTAPPFVIPGTGTLKISKLLPDQTAQATKDGGKAVLLKGMQFIAEFSVKKPAEQPNPPPPVGPGGTTPDPCGSYPGVGMFISTNDKALSS